ncbi:MAG: hypothetical protein WC284_09210 [Candidimonas sp.]
MAKLIEPHVKPWYVFGLTYLGYSVASTVALTLFLFFLERLLVLFSGIVVVDYDVVDVMLSYLAVSAFFSFIICFSICQGEYRRYRRCVWVLAKDESRYYVTRYSLEMARSKMAKNLHHSYPFIENVFTGERIYRDDPEFIVQRDMR